MLTYSGGSFTFDGLAKVDPGDHNFHVGTGEPVGTGLGEAIRGGGGVDAIFGGSGADFLVGQSGDDFVAGASGDDFVNGGFGADSLFGNQSDDVLDGGDGVDVLTSGSGDGQFTGGAGSAKHVAGSGRDVIVDFQSGPGGDIIDLRILGLASIDDVVAITSNNALGALSQISDTDTVNVLGVAAGDLNDQNELV